MRLIQRLFGFRRGLPPAGTNGVKRLEWTPELVERFWTGFSQTRLTEFDFARQGGKSLIVAVENHLRKDGSQLDFGAGNGELVEFLLERGYQTAAYEPSFGRRRHLRAKLGGKQGFLGVVGKHTRKQFDVVLMTEVIEHILDQDLDSALQRVSSLLRPRGTLIVTTPNNEDLDLGMAYCPVSNMLFHRWQHVRSFTPESLTNLLEGYGIEPVVVHQLEFKSDLFFPYDQIWAGQHFIPALPSHLVAMRANTPVRIGAENVILFVGRQRGEENAHPQASGHPN